ncbi:37173_t:CDS:2, partial [Gigaspora margarita]
PNRKQTTITKAFEISSAKLHNTTEQAIHDKTITEIHDGLYQAEEKLKVLSMRDLIKLAPTCTDAIAKYIEDVLEYWDLKTKVFLITSDSRTNMKSACNKLGIKWVPCSAHILNLIVQKGLLPAKKLITQMNCLITFFTTPKQSERLEVVQESIQKKATKIKPRKDNLNISDLITLNY